MATKPTEKPRWATTALNNGPGGEPNIETPPSTNQDSGWSYLEKPPREWFNWMQNLNYEWIEYFEELTDDELDSTRIWNGNSQVIIPSANGDIKLDTAGATRIFISTSGNVGIGTSSPSRKVSVYSPTGSADAEIVSDSSDSSLFIKGDNTNTTIANASGGGKLTLWNSDSTDGNYNVISSLDSSAMTLSAIEFINTSHSNNVGEMAILTRPSGGALTESVRVNGDGDVGIGTSSPGAKLDVDGNAIVQGGTVTLGQEGLSNGVINAFESIAINIDSNNDDGSEIFVIAKDRDDLSGGTELFRVQENGLVGIGTQSPTYLLDIRSTGTTPLSLTNTAGSTVWSRLANNANDYFIGYSTDKFLLSPDTSAVHLAINNGGDVGIGVSSPTDKLDVAGGATFDGNLTIKTDGAANKWILTDGNASATGRLGMQAGAGSSGFGGSVIAYAASHASKPGDIVAGISSGSAGRFRVNTSGDDSGNNIFVVEETGEVGIGTNSPTANLSVFSALDCEVELNGNGSGQSLILSQTSLGSKLFENSYNYLALGTNALERLRVDADGFVGIGVTSPGQRLDVAGNIRASGDILTSNGSAGGPSHTFTSAPTSGMFLDGSDNVCFTRLGVEKVCITGTGVEFADGFLLSSGSSGNPSYSFTASPTTGMFSLVSNEIAFSANGTTSVRISSNGLYIPVTGSAASPSIRLNDNDSGIYGGLSGVSISHNSTESLRVESSQIVALNKIRGVDGSTGSPTYSFGSDPNTGVYSYGPNILGITCGGTQSARFSQTTVFNDFFHSEGVGGSASAPAFSFEVDPDTGVFSQVQNVLGVAAGGLDVARFGTFGMGVNVAGSAANPSLRWDTDAVSDTGFYHPQDGALGLTLNGGAGGIIFDAVGGFVFISDTLIPTTASGDNCVWSASGFGGRNLLRVTSSARYKKDIRPFDDPTVALQIEPVVFKSAVDEDQETDHLGVIAEQVAPICPEAVSYNENGDPDGVYYERLVTPLLATVQAQDKMIKSQQTELEAIKQILADNNLI